MKPGEYVGSLLGSVISRLLNAKSANPLDYIQRQRGHSPEAHERAEQLEAGLLAGGSLDASRWVMCGEAWFQVDQFDRAAESYQRALTIDPLSPSAMNGLANVLKTQGDLGQAIAMYRRALDISPSDPVVFQNLLFAMLCSGEVGDAEILDWHLHFAREVEDPLKPSRYAHKRPVPAARPLRIGYVSADLRDHVTGRCINPILTHHDRRNFKTYCYFDGRLADDFTRNMQRSGGTWRDMSKMDDAQLAKQIKADHIDILVDLSGHTPGNRLLAFARKPAPIQVSYLDYSATTGFESIDYRLTTARCDTEGEADACYSETLYRLPDTYWLYNPPEVPDLAPPDDKPWLLLSCLNSFYRVSDSAIVMWADTLRRVPRSRLALVGVPMGEARDRVLERFGKLGVSASRIEMFGILNHGHYLQLVRATDIALAPFPYNGAMTMLDCLWNGVPVVSLRGGPTFRSSMGNCILGLLKLEELIADRDVDYSNIVVALAENRNRRLELRAGLRERLKRSPLCDAPALTKAIETAYRYMWEQYCLPKPQ